MRQPPAVLGVKIFVVTAGVIAVAAWTWPAARPSPRALPGWSLYDRLCVACHGADGDGLGPAAPYTWGRPRSFSLGDYKWRSTPIGEPPTDEDLRTTIRFGAPSTSMHAFDLAPAQLDELVAVVKSFAPAQLRSTSTRVSLGAPPAVDAEEGAVLWRRCGCVSCHGDDGKGQGPAAINAPSSTPASASSPKTSLASMPPYDLTRTPVRRPRATDTPAARREAIAMSIATGLSGTSMPGYAGTLTDAQIWALADHVLAIGDRGGAYDARGRRDRSALDAASIELDRAARIMAGTWPGRGPEAVVFGQPVAPQGPPPSTLAPAQASLSAKQCGRCHAKQVTEWTGSIHSLAAGPGLLGQIDHALPPNEAASCRRCHAPLAEQATDLALRSEGIQCAGCHVRQWTRHGPPNVSPSLLPLPGYPLQTLELYERGDFCMTCHQLPPRTAVNGKPLLNTYKEWLEGPYMKRGVQCQHCHMPNREHTFKGIHDRETFRQGFELFAHAVRKADTTTVLAEIVNVGAGHYLPTTPTPAVHVTIELLDAKGALVASSTYAIKRGIYFDGKAWHETSDTRIPPGETRSIARAWKNTRRATQARVTVEVHPDAFYEVIYAQRLKGKVNAAQVALYQQALATAVGRRYVAETRTFSIQDR
ncbi:MAG: cytochrome c [Kofleriaceae bacterium]